MRCVAPAQSLRPGCIKNGHSSAIAADADAIALNAPRTRVTSQASAQGIGA
ncbi:hypothetical protein Salmuc_00708 [Salipiger mucosus DSM 16094]|uniref:Uncharacterized protein n=1 Tax=Salipiger mucosus DSM 16094 TaxID=1123237 RepID=S9RD59_9RHOB|nr:hypothetical protein Salmuc_00708 [Salipiger mucosus DSM 16094]